MVLLLNISLEALCTNVMMQRASELESQLLKKSRTALLTVCDIVYHLFILKHRHH